MKTPNNGIQHKQFDVMNIKIIQDENYLKSWLTITLDIEIFNIIFKSRNPRWQVNQEGLGLSIVHLVIYGGFWRKQL